MKKLLLTLITLFPLIGIAQQVTLTDKGFVNVADNTKDYVVIEVPNKSKEVLFKDVKRYINTIFNNPKFVTSEIENEQIVLDAIDKKNIAVMFRLSGTNIWSFNYKYEIEFKDNKIKFTPNFKGLTNYTDEARINLIGSSFMGNATGIYNSKGKLLREKAKNEIDNSVNSFILNLKESINNTNQKSDW